MKPATIKYIHNRKNELRPDGTALIQLMIYLPGEKQTKYASTGLYVRPDQWNQEAQEVRKHEKKNDYNGHLKAFRLPYEEVNRQAALENRDLSSSDLKRLTSAGANPVIVDFYQEYLDTHHEYTLATKKSHNTTLKHFKLFSMELRFTDLDRRKLDGFKSFLFAEEMNENSVTKNLKNLKVIYTKALDYGLIPKDPKPFQGLRYPKAEPQRDFLRPDELRKIENVKIPNNMPGIDKIRDRFLFQCYTGLRYSDVVELNAENFINTEEGVRLLFRAQKTGKSGSWPLRKLFRLVDEKLSRPEKIYEKYQSDWGKSPWKIENQVYNRGLKDLAKLAGIDKNLTTHVARHTFGAYMIRVVPINVVKTLMQHSDLKATAVYLKLDASVLEEELDKLGDWI